VKEQVLESPFCKKEFLELVDIVSEVKTTKLTNYAISDSSIVNIGDRDFVDYRPDISIDPQVLKDNNISSISFDSLHFFQVQNLVEEIDTKSVKIKKSDVAVNLILPKTYEEYLESLTKKNRHELRRKKRKFDNETTSYELGESKEQDIFDIFISQHRESKGEKGEFMTEVVETYFRNLLNLGFVDTVKYFVDGNTNWTFWGYRGGSWQKGNGLRIDHFLTTPEVTDLIKSVNVNREPRGWEKASDHTPVTIELVN